MTLHFHGMTVDVSNTPCITCVHGRAHYSGGKYDYLRPEIQTLRKWQIYSLNLHQKRILVKYITPIQFFGRSVPKYFFSSYPVVQCGIIHLVHVFLPDTHTYSKNPVVLKKPIYSSCSKWMSTIRKIICFERFNLKLCRKKIVEFSSIDQFFKDFS